MLMKNNLALIRLTAWSAVLVFLLAVFSNGPSIAVGDENPDANKAAAEDQPEGDEAADEETEVTEGTLNSLGGMIFKVPESTSEWFSLFFYLGLAAFSMYAATVTFERLLNLKRNNILPLHFEQSLKTLISSQQDTKEQFSRLANEGESPAHLILQTGAKRAGRPLPEVEKAMEDTAIREITALQAKNRPLSVVASTAPLVGLLGTVVGMIFAFQISSQEGLGKAELLMKGIYLALLTTAGGLTIAIPCLLLVAMFNAKVDRYFREVDMCLLQTVPSFTRMEFQAEQAAKAVKHASNSTTVLETADEREPATVG